MPPAEITDNLRNELQNVRDDMRDNKYMIEAVKVLEAGGLRSAIGCYWNAVIDDLRRKVAHRSLDLFNKEMKCTVRTYEDFQDNVTDKCLIDGAARIGVLDWEARKMMHQARETRNIFDGHPDSSNPSILKVFNLIADCNRYVLSREYPTPIINVNDYLTKMDSDTYYKNELAVEQAFIDLPDTYKDELANKIVTYYTGDKISTRFRANIEFSFPTLWKVLPKEIRQTIAKRIDKIFIEGDAEKNRKSVELLAIVDGLRYLGTATRRMIYEPKIKLLETHLDDWDTEAKAVSDLAAYGSVVPDELVGRLVTALTLTYVGYDGRSSFFSRTAFYSNGAAPLIYRMFGKFDNRSAEEFVNAIRTNAKLKRRIRHAAQLSRLRSLGQLLLDNPAIKEGVKSFLTILIDEARTDDFYRMLGDNAA